MIILAIDPGEKTSGYVVYDSDKHCVLESQSDADNGWLTNCLDMAVWPVNVIVCEKPAAMGQPLSGNLVETTLWAGRMWQAATRTTWAEWHWITRNAVKVAICGGCKGVKDAHVLTGVQERFGGKQHCRGTLKQPGPCLGVSGHAWQALACAIAWLESQKALVVS